MYAEGESINNANNASREYKDSVFVNLFSRDEKTRKNRVCSCTL